MAEGVKYVPDNKKRKKNAFIYCLPGLIFLFMIIVVPQAYQKIKMFLLLIVFFEIFAVYAITHRYYLHRKIVHFFIFFIFLGLIFGIYGFTQGNPGTIPITRAMVLYFAFYAVLVSGVRNYSIFKYVHKTLVFSTCFVCVYMIISYLHTAGTWPNWLYYDLSTDTATQDILIDGLEQHGRFEMVFSSYCNLMFLQPYLFFCLFASKDRASKSLWFAVIVSTIFMIFSSSRVLLVIALFFPLIIVLNVIISGIINLRIKKNILRGVVIIFTIIILTIIPITYFKQYGFSVSMVYQDLVDGVAPSMTRPGGNEIENSRIGQTLALINGWKQRPLFGFGSGAAYWGYLRNAASPWQYEVAFAQFLYYWGMIGCMLYAAGLCCIYRALFKAYKEKSNFGIYGLSAVYGSIVFIIGSASNPYLLRFDSFFIIFIPVAIANLYFFEKDKNFRSK